MDVEKYWTLVERAREDRSEPEQVAARLTELLAELPVEEIEESYLAYHRITARGYTWSLWGAAYLINGGCGDDGFEYFRGWLVARGRTVFEAALRDPDSLADVLTKDDFDMAECESMLGAPWSAARLVTGEGLTSTESVPLPDLGEGWDFEDDDEMGRRYPRLTELFA